MPWGERAQAGLSKTPLDVSWGQQEEEIAPLQRSSYRRWVFTNTHRLKAVKQLSPYIYIGSERERWRAISEPGYHSHLVF